MGLLDDAIREHLDLKRARGADPTEIERLEREALGPVRRERPMGAAQFDETEQHEVELTPAEEAAAYYEGAVPHEADDQSAPPLSLAGAHAAEDQVPQEEAPRRRGFLRRGRPAPPPEPVQVEDDEAVYAEDAARFDQAQDEPALHDDPLADHELLADGEPMPDGELLPREDFPPEDLPPEEPSSQDRPPASDQLQPARQPPPLAFEPPPARPRFTPEPPTTVQAPEQEPAGPVPGQKPAGPAEMNPPPAELDEEPAARQEPQATREFDALQETAPAAEQEADALEAPAPAAEQAEDVLEETPEFLQDTPEHDRLWFEQRPPRDFDFDG